MYTSLIATSLVSAYVAVQPSIVYHNDTNFGGQIWSAHETNFYIKYLGNFSAFSDCLSACLSYDKQPGARCKALSWYAKGVGTYKSQGCYTRIDGEFQPGHETGVTSAVLTWPCNSDEDCNLNGKCMPSGQCSCDPQWGSEDCGVLQLLPAPKSGGYQRTGLNQWGGNPFFSHGEYHVFAVELTLGCQIHDYTTNSQIVHATSPTPLGPYSFKSIWLPPFAHTPRAWPGPNGSLYVSYVGRQLVPAAAQKDCRTNHNSAVLLDAESPRAEPNDYPPVRNPECVGLMVAESASGNVSGPWTHRYVYDPQVDEWYGALPSDLSSIGVRDGGINNPSIFIHPNGSTLIAGRTCTWPEHVFVASAPNWKGPYQSVSSGPVIPNPDPSDEDPYLWRDVRGNYHMLLHHQDDNANQLRNGAHAYSRDGITWIWSPTIAYTNMVAWDDGSSTHFDRRERPGLLLDPTWRTPLALFSAVSNATHQWLHAQPIRQTFH